MAANFLQRSRHGSVFYFRRRVPDDLRMLCGQRQILRSLSTTDRRQAIGRARALAVETDQLFERVREMAKKGNEGLRVGYILEVGLDDLGRPKGKLNAEAHETEAAKAVIASVVPIFRTDQAPPAILVSPLPIASGPTVTEAIAEFQAGATLKRRSMRRYLSDLRKFEAFIGGETRLSAVTQEQIAAHAAHVMLARVASRRSSSLAALRAAPSPGVAFLCAPKCGPPFVVGRVDSLEYVLPVVRQSP